jgi:hypothetical protein
VAKLQLYTFFHLNLMFSSIEEEMRPEVIRRCYWPLLRLIKKLQLPIGIETPACTLEFIAAIDPDWIEELRTLCGDGPAEFIGSGYAQLIGPLVPAAVNHANQRLGLQTYERLLGFRPQLALVNEQAYAAGLVPIYRQAGYRAIIMEWDNAASTHPEWDPEWRYLPHYACGPGKSEIPLIWNKSIPFQKFQRYTHGELPQDEYLDFLAGHVGPTGRTFALYGNDAEIFDFRPGRFQTEAAPSEASEWERIGRLYAELRSDNRFQLIAPSRVLDCLDRPEAGQRLRLETAPHPLPVKKQAKYNIVRWSSTGRDDLALNTACWQLYEALATRPDAAEGEWKELCYLWSSDFRTHITALRWQKLQNRLAEIKSNLPPHSRRPAAPSKSMAEAVFRVNREGSYLNIETSEQMLRLNCRRGLAVDGWWNKRLSPLPLLGTLPHGYFDNIQYGADYYTGHLVMETAGRHKITDLCAVDPQWKIIDDNLEIYAHIETPLGRVDKIIRVCSRLAQFQLIYKFYWPSCPIGTLRLGHLTLNPEAFRERKLFFRTHNGGDFPETFQPAGHPLNHLAPVSTLVSANAALGMTSGKIELGDFSKTLRIEVDKAMAALTGHVVYAPVDNTYLYRLVLSAMEMDDTACHVKERNCFNGRPIRLTITSDI